jgi:hypothetical protein
VFLSRNRPRWTDRICLYNPTSILWRYFVIADRRVRSLNWTTMDMAASNAHFWLGSSWDGSEDMIVRSRRFCIRLPVHSYVHPLSSSALKTLIVTLQGAQALYEILGTISVYSQYSVNVNLGSVFLPLAILGLLRLPAALWMSEDLVYADKDLMELRTANLGEDKETGENMKMSERVTTSLLLNTVNEVESERFHPTNGIRGIAIRSLYLVIIILLTGFTLFSSFPGSTHTYVTATAFTQIVFFDFFLVSTLVILLYYIVRGDSKSTIIPCLTSIWYKIYTVLLFLGMLILIIFAAVETRKTWCGVWTTYPEHPPGKPENVFNYCPQSFEIQTSELSWNRNNGTSNGTGIAHNFNGLITGSWTLLSLPE